MLLIVGINNLNAFYVKIRNVAYMLYGDPPHVVSTNLVNTLLTDSPVVLNKTQTQMITDITALKYASLSGE